MNRVEKRPLQSFSESAEEPAVETIAAPATPPGTSAVGLIRISGPRSHYIIRAFSGGLPLPPPRVATVRRLSHRGELLDEALVTIFGGPRSYTGEDMAEIGCHGNPLIARRILDAAFDLGARLAHPGEFTQRAFLNGRMDLTQAEAVMDVIAARTDLALRSAHAAREGRLGRAVASLRETLVDVLAQIEAHIDFPDEGIEPAAAGALRGRLDAQADEIERMLSTAGAGRILREGVRTVIAGAPNAGKSSLLNALVGSDRAIVTPLPGTTRDTVEEWINVEGIPLHLIDTAGIRETSEPAEIEGVRRSRRALEDAELILLVTDASAPPAPEEEAIARQCDRSRTLAVATKSDLPAARETGGTRVSAVTGEGIDALKRAIAERVWSGPPTGESLVTVNARHRDCLRRAVAPLRRAAAGLGRDLPLECAAIDLREGLTALTDIIGITTTEDILGRLFSAFCIGK